MTPPETLSIRAYAQHRGISDTAVRKALKKGKITAEPNGTINPEKADRQWRESTRESANPAEEGSHPGSQSGADGSHPGLHPDLHDAIRLAREMEAAAASPESKAEAERRKEIALANIRERQDRQGAGELVDRQATAQAWFSVARTARDQFLAVRERLEVRLGLTTEQLDVVSEELRAVLYTLAKEVPNLGDPLPELVEL